MTEQTSTTAAIVSAAIKGDVAHKVGQTGSIGALAFGLTLNDIGVIVGIVGAVLGFGMQLYFKRKEFRLKQMYYAKHGVKDATEGEPK